MSPKSWCSCVALAAAAAIAPPAANAARPADTVLRNGTVLTVDGKDRVAQAVAIRGGRIAFVGSDRAVRRFVGRRTKVVDLRGKTAMPGLIDGHAHPLAGGDILDDCDLGNGESTVAELQRVIRDCDAADPATGPSDWLGVSNWNPAGMLPRGTVVASADLDAVSTSRPIIVMGSDGHNSWVNSRAFQIAGVTAATPNPADGEIVRNPDGTPRGLLKDGATGLVSRHIPEKSFRDVLADARRGQDALNAVGITTVADASANAGTLAAWNGLAKRGQLKLRLSSFVRIDNDQNPKQAWRYAADLSRRYATPGLQVRGVKFFLDGVMEHPAQTAALLQPYLEERGGRWVPGKDRGDLYFSQRRLDDLMTTFDAKGWRIHMHAIGDRAVRSGLDAVAAARRANRSRASKLNATIAHLELVDATDRPRFRQLGVFASMQLQWAIRDVWTEESLAPYLGARRHREIYPARGLLDAGAPFAQGSDWPVDTLNPWVELETADTRTLLAKRGDLFRSTQGISIATAVRAHTMGAARQLGLQHETGSLEVGKSADVIVLDRNVLKVSPKDVGETKVLRTYLRGRSIYADSAAGRATVRLAGNRSEPNGRAHLHDDRAREHH